MAYQTTPFTDNNIASTNRVYAAFLNAVNQRIYRDSFSVKNDPYSATGDGSTDDYTAIAAANTAADAADSILFFPPGTYVIGTNITLANVYLATGAILSPSTGITVTISQLVDADASQHFAGAGSIVFGSGACNGLRPEWWYTSSWATAIVAACNAMPTSQYGMALLFLPKLYSGCTQIVVPAVSEQNKSMFWKGEGGAGSTRKPTLQFTATPGAAGIQVDFSQGNSYIRLENLQFEHAAGAPTGTSHGIGIKFPSGTGGVGSPGNSYVQIDDVWVTGFDKGVSVEGYSIYGRIRKLVCQGNYSYGFYANAALFNVTSFDNCQFGGTINGRGAYFATPGAALAFNTCGFEGNIVYGIEAFNYNSIKFDSCYFEQQTDIDCYLPNTLPGSESLTHFANCYFDEDLDKSHRRIRAKRTRLLIESTHFYRTAATDAPVLVELSQSAPSATPHIALNCSYPTASISDNDEVWIVQDAKHPRVGQSAGAPASQPLQLGDFRFSTAIDTVPEKVGYSCNSQGWISTVPATGVTATTVAASATVTLNTTDHNIVEGYWIQIVGETFGGSALAYVKVLEVIGATLIIAETAVTGVAAAAVSFKEGTVIPLYSDYNYIEEYGLSVASGASVGLLQFTIAAGAKAVIIVDGIMGSTANDSNGTYRRAQVVVGHDGSGIDLGTPVYTGDASGVDGATTWTITLSEPSAGLCRVFVTQSTGNTLNFGYKAKVINNKVAVTAFSSA